MRGEPWRVEIRRNPSWTSSLRLTFGRSLFYAPSALVWLQGDSFRMAFAGLKLLLVALVCIPLVTLFWAVMTTVQIICGLLGFISPPSTVNQTSLKETT